MRLSASSQRRARRVAAVPLQQPCIPISPAVPSH
jgi:hypothetical protein